MSYNINLVNIDGEEIYDDNYTYNVGNMFRDAIGGDGLYELHETLARENITLLEKAIFKMQNNPEYYKKMNPKNGWGNYEGALMVLVKLYSACLNNPDSVIVIS